MYCFCTCARNLLVGEGRQIQQMAASTAKFRTSQETVSAHSRFQGHWMKLLLWCLVWCVGYTVDGYVGGIHACTPTGRKNAPDVREEDDDSEGPEERDEEDNDGGELLVHLQLVCLVLLPQDLLPVCIL